MSSAASSPAPGGGGAGAGGASGTTTPSAGPPPRSATAQLEGVFRNIPSFFVMEREGKLAANSLAQIRALIANQASAISSWCVVQSRPNPLLEAIPDRLNPTLPLNGGPPLLSRAKLEEAIKNGTQEGRLKKSASPNQASAAKVPTAGQPSAQTPGGANATAPRPQRPAGQTSVANTGSSTPGPRPPSANGNAVPPVNAIVMVPGQNGAMVPFPRPVPPRELLSVTELQSILKASPAGREALFSQPDRPDLKYRYQVSLNYHQQLNKYTTALAAQQAQRSQGTATTTAAAPAAQAPAPPPAPRPYVPPPESDESRRKRKVRDFVNEDAPGIEIEEGIVDLLGEVGELLVEDIARGGLRLAKHRKSKRVEVKDVATWLRINYDLTLAGFDVHPEPPVHVAPEDRKRLRVIAPRAARGRAAAAAAPTTTAAPPAAPAAKESETN